MKRATDDLPAPGPPARRPLLRRAVRYLLPILLRRWSLLFVSALALVSLVTAELYKPWPLKLVFDNLLVNETFLPEWAALPAESQAAWMLVVICAMVLGLAALAAIAHYVKEYTLNRLGEEIAFELRVALFSHIQRLGLGYYDSSRLGDIITRVTEDTRSVRDMATTSLLQTSAAVLSIASFLVMMLVLDWKLALVGLLNVLVLGPTVWYYRRRIEKAARKRRDRESELTSVTQETISSIRLVQTLGSHDRQRRAFDHESSKSAQMGLEVARLQAGYLRTLDFIGAFGLCAVICIGVHRVWAGSLTAGALFVFTYYVKNMFGPMRDLAKQSAKIAKGRVGLERVLEVLELEPTVVQSPHARKAQLSGRIEFEHVGFAYKPGRPTLHDLSFAIEPGQVVALVGHSGAGKSTILSLISRLYDPSQGRILVDGHDLKDLELDSLREQISVVLQESILFQTTIGENILYGRSDATQEQLVDASAAAGVDLFLDRLPKGYDTVVGPRGATLSGGERQRVAIARAIVRDAPILILDEPTTGLDAKSEQLVMRALSRLMADRTTLVVSHKLSLIERADQILVLDGGRLVESGTHAELLQAGGHYARLLAAANDAGVIGTGSPRIDSVEGEPMNIEDPLPLDNQDEPDTDPVDVTGVLAHRLGQLRNATWLNSVLESALAQMMPTGPRVTSHDIDYCKIKPNRDINVALRARLGDEGDLTRRLSCTFYASAATCRTQQAEEARLEPFVSTQQQLLAAGFVRPVAVLDEPAMIVRAFPMDPALPGLAAALDPGEVLPLFASRLEACRRTGAAPHGITHEILHYKPRRSCAIHYRIDLGGDTARVYGKLSRDGRGNHHHALLASAFAAATASGGLWRAARPMGYVERWRLLLQEAVPGRDFRLVFADLTPDDVTDAQLAQAGQVLDQIARAIRGLQRAAIVPGAIMTFERLLAAQERNLHYMSALQPELARELAAIRAEAIRLERETRRSELVFAHGDFAHGNLLIEGDRIGIIDFDKAGAAEPAYDVAYFLTHMWSFGLRHEKRMRHVTALSQRFRKAYLAEAPEVSSERLALYEALDFAAYVLRNFRKQSHQGGWLTWAEGQVAAAWDRLGVAAGRKSA